MQALWAYHAGMCSYSQLLEQVYTGLSNPSAGQAYYEDLCMNAVNQCIGRVIRHANDWAAILLADARWAAPSSACKTFISKQTSKQPVLQCLTCPSCMASCHLTDEIYRLDACDKTLHVH